MIPKDGAHMQIKNLFHEKVLSRHFDLEKPINDESKSILFKWATSAVQGLKEITNHGAFSHIILKMLGYTVAAESPASWTAYPEFAIGKKSVDIGLGHFSSKESNLLVPLELKGGKTDLDLTMPGRNKSPVEQAWEYAVEIGAQWVMVSNYKELRLYSYAKGKSSYESFNLLLLSNNVREYNKFINILSAENLLGGLTQKILNESDKADKDITNELYDEYSSLRTSLIKHLLTMNDNKFVNPSLAVIAAQKLIDRILFIAFAEDRHLLPAKIIEKAFTHIDPFNPKPIWDNFKGLFKAIDKGSSRLGITGYNGGLFKYDDNLDSLQISDELCELFKKISEYDFNTEINVNILGHIFEQSITDLENIKLTIDNSEKNTSRGRRKRDGVFYTPDAITKFIVENTIGAWLKDRRREFGFDSLPELNEEDFGRKLKTKKEKFYRKVQVHIDFWLKYRDALSRIKVCDPACGSGAFLNQAFDFLYNEGQRINGELQRLRGGVGDLLRWDTHIIKNNLYGVDINSESVELTKLSLWIKTAKRNEKLTYLDDNIKWGNSLISDTKVSSTAIAWGEEFLEIITHGGFDIVIGNPPYGAELNKCERKYLSSEYTSFEYQVNTYTLFFELGTNILKENGYLSYITPATYMYQHYYRNTRKMISQYSVRLFARYNFQIFPDANIGDTITTVIKKSSVRDNIMVFESKNINDLHSSLLTYEYFDLISHSERFDTHKNTTTNFGLVTVDLGSIADIVVGIKPYQTGKGTPKQNTSTVKYKPFTHSFSQGNNCHPCFIGRDFHRYRFLNHANMFLEYGDWLAEPRNNAPFFEDEKIIVRQTADSLIAHLDTTKSLNLNNVYNINSKDKNYPNKYILAVLNSKYMNNYYQSLVQEKGKLFAEVKKVYLKCLPIVKPSTAILFKIEQLVDTLISNFNSMQQIENSFLRLLFADIGTTVKMSSKSSVFFHNSNSFMSSILNGNNCLSLTEKSKWIDYFEAEQNKYISLRLLTEDSIIQVNSVISAIYG